MISEDDLLTLADPDSGPHIRCRPVGDVVNRGASLRRRRRIAKAFGAITAVAGLSGAGLLAVEHQPGGGSDGAGDGITVTATADEPSTSTGAGDWPLSPPPPADCEPESGDQWVPANFEQLPPGEVPDELRLIPTWIPEGKEITRAIGARHTNPCPEAGPQPADPALVLRAQAEGGAPGSISLMGPLPRPMDSSGEQETVELRGTEAILVSNSIYALGWTEPDGWSWWLTGDESVDATTLTSVAEALELDSSPEGDAPVADLTPGDLPQGFEISWQARGTPTPTPTETTTWSVVVGEQQEVTRGIVCHLEVEKPTGELGFDWDALDGEIVTINGQDALWTTSWGPFTGFDVVIWEVTPGVRAGANCSNWDSNGAHSLDIATQLAFAESVEPVAPDDPRLPE